MGCSDSEIRQDALKYMDSMDFLWVFNQTAPRTQLTPLEIYTLMSCLIRRAMSDLKNYQVYFSGDRGCLETHASVFIEQKLKERAVKNAIDSIN